MKFGNLVATVDEIMIKEMKVQKHLQASHFVQSLKNIICILLLVNT